MKSKERLHIRGPDDGDNGLLEACYGALSRSCHVHILEQNEPPATFAASAQSFVFIDSAGKAGDDTCGERERFTRVCSPVSQKLARPGRIDFDRAMYHGLALNVYDT